MTARHNAIVTNAVSEWLDRERGYTLATQRARIETAKLLATFVVGLAGAVVASALQVGNPNGWDIAAVVFLGLSVLGVVAVLLLDRTQDVDVPAVATNALQSGWTKSRVLAELQRLAHAALTSNEAVVQATRRSAGLTAISALIAAGLAIVSLLHTSA